MKDDAQETEGVIVTGNGVNLPIRINNKYLIVYPCRYILFISFLWAKTVISDDGRFEWDEEKNDGMESAV